MSLIKNLYVLSVPYTHFKIFYSFPLIKDCAFLGSMKSFPFVVVPEIDVVLSLGVSKDCTGRVSVQLREKSILFVEDRRATVSI